jgi:hypothetical protein
MKGTAKINTPTTENTPAIKLFDNDVLLRDRLAGCMFFVNLSKSGSRKA